MHERCVRNGFETLNDVLIAAGVMGGTFNCGLLATVRAQLLDVHRELHFLQLVFDVASCERRRKEARMLLFAFASDAASRVGLPIIAITACDALLGASVGLSGAHYGCLQ